jgi:Fis family transcriptional regulator
MANQLNIQVGADVSGAISGLNQLETKTAKAFNEVRRSSGAAQQTVLNFGRVIQDAPYAVIAGNIGAIANNIDPLVESFTRARQQGGTFGGTLKEIGKSLIGPAGIGLAISAVTSALVLWGGRSKKAKSETDDFAKSLQNAKAQAVSTGLQLQQFVDTAKNSTLPLEQRNEALRKANEILGKYGETLTLTNIATAKATDNERTNEMQTKPSLMPELGATAVTAMRDYMQFHENAVGIYRMIVDAVEAPVLKELMKMHMGNQSAVAKTLGINRATLRTKLKRHGLI